MAVKKGKEMTEAERLANEHWDYVGGILEQQYKTAFIHGFKHGVEAKKEEEPPGFDWYKDCEALYDADYPEVEENPYHEIERLKDGIRAALNTPEARCWILEHTLSPGEGSCCSGTCKGHGVESDGEETVYETSTGRFLVDEKGMED